MAWHYNSVPAYHLPHLPYHSGFSSHYGYNPLYGKSTLPISSYLFRIIALLYSVKSIGFNSKDVPNTK